MRLTSQLAAAAVLCVLAGASSCRAPPPDAGAPGPTTPAAQAPRVVLESPSGRRSTVRVELARTPQEQERGLMFREQLGADDGMLFLFDETREHPFWMKNTVLPLDMIFMDPAGVVVGIVEGAEPFTTAPRTVGVPSRYVLEVNAGWSKAHGVAPGDRSRFEGFEP